MLDDYKKERKIKAMTEKRMKKRNRTNDLCSTHNEAQSFERLVPLSLQTSSRTRKQSFDTYVMNSVNM